MKNIGALFKFIFAILAISFAVFVVIVGYSYYQLEVGYPKSHAQNTEVAAELNAENWKEGHALRVIASVSSDEALGSKTSDVSIICYTKSYARAGGIKGPPAIHERIIMEGPRFLTIPFGPNATHNTDLADLCSNALREGEEWQLPRVIDSSFYGYSFWSSAVANDNSFQCFFGSAPQTSKGSVSRPTLVSIEKLAVRDVVEYEAYLSLPSRSDEANVRPPETYYWLEGKQENAEACWRRDGPAHPCADEVQAVCGRALR